MRWWIEEGTWRFGRDETLIWRYATKHDAQTMLHRIDKAYEILENYPELLADEPHPKLPESELTARDYAIWLLANAQYNGIWRALELVVNGLGLLMDREEEAEKAKYEGTNIVPFPKKRGKRKQRARA
jgi:hypothetical protein